MEHVAVTAIGVDRPGIVAAVTGVLKEQGGNLEDTSMTILRGHFAMMLVVEVPSGSSPEGLQQALAEVAQRLHLVVTVRSIDEAVAIASAGQRWALAVYGADRPGIVHAITSWLAEMGANITDLATRIIGEPDHPVYAMHLDVWLPPASDSTAVAAQLAELAGGLGVEATMHPADADIL